MGYRTPVGRPLDGVRVIDTSTGPAGGVATMVLADFGADVIKVEPPGGDRFRSLAASPLWLRGKRSVVLDLHTDSGRAHLQDLVRSADVLVTGGPPARSARWGVDYAAAVSLRPDIVHCSLTGWGETGPLANLPGYAATVAARAGRMKGFTGQVLRDGPVYSALPAHMHIAAHGAVQGIVSGLLARDRTGLPQRVTTSLLQSLMPFDLVDLLLIQMADRWGASPIPNPQGGAALPSLNYHPVMAGDGRWIQCGNLLEHLFLSFLDAIDLYGELLADERFLDSPAVWTPDAIEHVRDRILEVIQTKTADEWMAIFHENGNVAAEPYLTPAEAMDHPDLVDNGMIVEFDDPVVGRVRAIGPVSVLTNTPAVVTRPAPTIGQHTDEVLAEAVRSAPTRTAPAAEGATPSGYPLAGVTILEFATVIAAPLGTSMLADLGARVIRVEPMDGDPFRHLYGHGYMTVKTTAGKESIYVDMKRPEARDIVQRLLRNADVLVHNYRPGVPERLGIGYEQLAGDHPGLVWVSVLGYGPHGPSAHRPATHPCAGAAMGGAGFQAGSALTRTCSTLEEVREASRQIMKANEANPDPNTSAIVASSTLLALLARSRDPQQRGQAVYVDMMTANAHANIDAFLSYDGMAARPVMDDALLGLGACDRLYRCSEGWVALTVTTDAEWERLCAVAARFDLLADDRFTGAAGRQQHDRDLAGVLEALFATRTAVEWEAVLAGSGVACVQADECTPGEFEARSEHLRQNGFVPVVQHARFGEMRRWGPIVQVNGGRDSYGPGVLGGADTDSLLAEIGYTPAEIATLRSTRAVSSEDTAPYSG